MYRWGTKQNLDPAVVIVDEIQETILDYPKVYGLLQLVGSHLATETIASARQRESKYSREKKMSSHRNRIFSWF